MTRITSRILLLAFLLVPSALILTNCGDQPAAPAPATPTVSVFPPAASVLVSGTIQFAASGAGTSYTWAVNGTTGGDSTVGTISASGLYTAPSVPPSGSVTIAATSAISGNPTGNAVVTVTNPVPVVASVSPSTIFTGAGDTMITVLGSQFQPSTTVMVGGTALATEYWSSTQLTAVVPAVILSTAAASTVTVTTPGPGGGLDNNAVLTVVTAGVVTSTGHPLVAKYSISIPRDAKVTVEFGPDTNYGRRTSAQPTPAGGGPVNILVAGMRQFSSYHMRAIIDYPEGSQVLDADHLFTTGGLPAARVPQVSVSHPAAGPANGGVELLDLTSGTSNQVKAAVTDLNGNLIWYYDFDGAVATPLIPFPIRPLPNGNILVNVSPAGAAGTGGAGVLREIDLAGNTIWELTTEELNTRLAAAGFSLSVDSVHHDVIPLPDEHLMLLVNTHRTLTDLVGLPGDTVMTGDGLVELDANHNPVWVWDCFDYLDVNRHPLGPADWTHGNGLAYSWEDGHILLSMRNQSWVLKIYFQNGFGTGELLWKLGYQGDFTIASGLAEDWFYTQHFPIFVSPNSSGNFTFSVWDNGFGRVFSDGRFCSPTSGGDVCYSRTPIFQIDETTKVATLVWPNIYNAYSIAVGSVVVFPNGNVEGDLGIQFPTSARVLERTEGADPQAVWQMDITGQFAYRAYRIPSLYPGVQW